jgi:hypothetical protein
MSAVRFLAALASLQLFTVALCVIRNPTLTATDRNAFVAITLVIFLGMLMASLNLDRP